MSIHLWDPFRSGRGYIPRGEPVDLSRVHPPRVPSPFRANCNLSNLVEMGGEKRHYGEIVGGRCTSCGLDEFAPGFVGPTFWRRVRRLVGLG